MNCPACNGHGVWKVAEESADTTVFAGFTASAAFVPVAQVNENLVICLVCNGSGAIEAAEV